MQKSETFNNKPVFDHVFSRGVESYTELARKVSVSNGEISHLQRGRQLISPRLLLRVLQEFPPRNWEELATIGDVWLPQRKRVLQSREWFPPPTKQPVRPLNKAFFDLMAEHGITVDNKIAGTLGVSRQYISVLRRGECKISLRSIESIREKLER